MTLGVELVSAPADLLRLPLEALERLRTRRLLLEPRVEPLEVLDAGPPRQEVLVDPVARGGASADPCATLRRDVADPAQAPQAPTRDTTSRP